MYEYTVYCTYLPGISCIFPNLNWHSKYFFVSFSLLAISSPDMDDPSTFPDTIKAAAELEGRRIIKTHLSVDMLPGGIMEKKAKVWFS